MKSFNLTMSKFFYNCNRLEFLNFTSDKIMVIISGYKKLINLNKVFLDF